jgi:cytoskeletal protein CcmA (bactofilin family)
MRLTTLQDTHTMALAAEGPVIGLIGDAGETAPNNKVLIDTTNNFVEFYVQVASAPVQQLYIADGAIIPVTDSDIDLGTSSLYFKNAYIDSITTTGNIDVGGNLTVTGTTTFNGGTITMGDAATDNVVFGADIDSNIIPDDDNTYDLGSTSQEWRNLYIDGTANIDSLVADTADINGGTIDGSIIGGTTAAAITGTAITGTSFVIGSADISEAELETIDGVTAGTVAASKAIVVDANKDITGGRNITITGEIDAATLDISGNADIDGTLEADAITIGGITLAETIADTVGAMVSSNTETGIAVSYDDADNTLDFVIGDDAIVQSMIADDAIDSQHYVDGSIDLVHLSANSVDSDQYVDGSIDLVHMSINSIDSDQYVDGSIDLVHMSANSVDSDQYVDGSIDLIHMSANSVDSDQYVDGSIDTVHLADDAVTGAKLADNIDIAGTLDVTGILTADSNVVVAGNLTVNGTTTTLNTATLDVEDKNITINYGAGDTSASANGAGITIQDAIDASNDATILWDTTNDEFDFSHAINVTGNIAVSGTVDGRDVATDGTKLDGIEALADVTDATNVTAAGALMDSELTAIASVKALNQGVATTDSPTFVNVTGTSLDISGDIDVDGTTNLDVVDVDGAVNFAADVTFADGADIITASAGTSNFRAGVNAGNSIESGGNYNTVVGDEAGTAITTGGPNTAVGYQAGTAITTGDNNTAMGYRALYTEDTGNRSVAIGDYTLTVQNNDDSNYNTAVGYAAGAAVTTGTINTLIGGLAGSACTVGNSNVAVGYGALQTDTAGDRAVAIGVNALVAQNFTSTTDNYNVAVGYEAGSSVTTGVQNTFLGSLAGDANTTASNNTAVGYSALGANTTGTQNVAVGTYAGDAVTTGGYNCIMGYQAGTYITDLITGDANCIIGSYARTTATDSANANIYGSEVTGAGGYTTVGFQNDDIRAAHGSITWATVSDERYKKDITDSTAGLSFINALQPRTFKYKTLGELPETFSAYEADSTKVFKNSNTNHGFIAQEVKAAIDADDSIKDGFKLWDDREDGSQEVAEAALIPVLVKAIQELSAQNDALTTRITALEG